MNRRIASKKRGHTFIELATVITIVGVIAASGTALFLFFAETAVTVPEEVDLDTILNDALSIIVDGDATAKTGAKGLRYADSIQKIDTVAMLFTNEDSQQVTFSLNKSNKITREITGIVNTLKVIPYYIPDNVSIAGEEGVIYTYFDADDNATTDASQVKRIVVRLNATSSSGATASSGTSVRVDMFDQEEILVVTEYATEVDLTAALLNMTYDFGDHKEGEVYFGFKPTHKEEYEYTKSSYQNESGSYSALAEGLESGRAYTFYALLMYKGPEAPIIVEGKNKIFTTLSK